MVTIIQNRKSTSICFRVCLVLALIFLTCEKNPSGPEAESGYSVDFEFIWETVDKYYPFLDFKQIDWDSIHSTYSPQVENATIHTLESIFVKLLGELKDGHANVYNAEGYPVYAYKIPRKEKDKDAFDISVVRRYLGKDFKQSDNLFWYEILPDSIGYVYCSRFSGVRDEYEKFDIILDEMKNTRGLIFDIRHNGGGNNISAYYFIKRMISSALEGVTWSRKGGGWYPVETYYPEGNFQYTKPTVLLVNGVCYSSAEGFANLCKKISHVTVIGDTTGGGGGVPEVFTMPKSKLKFGVPTRCQMRYDGQHIEWDGIPPDILVPQSREDIVANQDKQLEYAIKLLRETSRL